MAWLDDRVWCHPKFTDLTDRAGWTWTRSITYCSGMGTGGVLTVGQQKMVGSDAKVRRELVAAGLWDELSDESVRIHDWDDHNAKRDARRKADRDRKREARLSAGTSAGQSAGTSTGASTGTAYVDGSEGSEGSEEELTSPSPTARLDDHLWKRLLVATGVRDRPSIAKLVKTVKAHRSSEHDVVEAIRAATAPHVDEPLAVALSELKRRGLEKAA